MSQEGRGCLVGDQGGSDKVAQFKMEGLRPVFPRRDSYVVDIYQNRRGEEILIPIHNIRFYGEILKIITYYHFNTNPNFPLFSLIISSP